MKNRTLSRFAVALALWLPLAGHAALRSTTLEGVAIGAALYDVTFTFDDERDTRVDDVFGDGAPPLAFEAPADAFAAAQAIVSAVVASGFDLGARWGRRGFVLPFRVGTSTVRHYTGWVADPLHGTTVHGPFTDDRASARYPVAFATLAPAKRSTPRGALALRGARVGHVDRLLGDDGDS